MAKKFYIIDGHSLVHRAFYALPPLSTKGKPVGAVFGFARIILKLLREEQPDFFAVAFDTPVPTFRHKEYKEYKAHREKTPEDLQSQFATIREFLTALGVPIISKDGYEADDILGTLATRMAQKGHEAIIITGDRDALQLVSDKVKVSYTRKGISDTLEYDLKMIEDEYGLTPKQLIDVKALMGDSSDNIPGVPGIGEKTALKLIRDYGSLEDVLANLEILPTRARNALTNNLEMAHLSRSLAEIFLEVPLEEDEEELIWREPNWQEIAQLFKEWEFSSLLSSLPQKASLEKEINLSFQIVNDQEAWEKFKNEFKVSSPLAISYRVEGTRPREYNLEALGLSSGDQLYVIEGGKIKIEELLAYLKPHLIDANLGKIGHDLKACLEVFLNYGIEMEGLIFDTFIASYITDPSATTPSFSQLAQRLKGLTSPPEGSNEALAFEANHLAELVLELEKTLQEIDSKEILTKIDLPLIGILAKMENNGVKIDQEYLDEFSKELEKQLAEISENIFSFTAQPFNINSPKQLGEILFEELQLPVIKRTKTGYSTGAEILDKLKDHHPIINHILAYRQLAKLKSTYSDALPPLVNEKTQRLHTTFNQTVTATGRLSSTEPNLQNIPIRTPEGRKIRKAFIAQEGYQLLAADYSQIELRVLAHISGDKGLVDAFQKGQDIHKRTAAEVFAVEQEEVTNELRQRAKAINFGIVYGMSAFGLAQDLGLAQDVAQSYIDRYFSRYPLIKSYIDDCIDKARSKGYVTTIFNRRRYLPDIKHRLPYRRGFAERMAINTPIQGTAADIMKLAMIEVSRALKDKAEVLMLLQVHDELILEVPIGLEEEVERIVRAAMENAYKLIVPLLVDIKVGSDWLAL